MRTRQRGSQPVGVTVGCSNANVRIFLPQPEASKAAVPRVRPPALFCEPSPHRRAESALACIVSRLVCDRPDGRASVLRWRPSLPGCEAVGRQSLETASQGRGPKQSTITCASKVLNPVWTCSWDPSGDVLYDKGSDRPTKRLVTIHELTIPSSAINCHCVCCSWSSLPFGRA
jgi:hypothetical protein